jgi:TrmH family RNA methyltransferase
MLSKAQIRFLTSLQQKKFRKMHQAFIVEGAKSVEEFIFSSYKVLQVYATSSAIAKLPKIPDNIKLYEATDEEFHKISALHTPQGILAVVEIPQEPLKDSEIGKILRPDIKNQFILALDDVQDPGNLGTIIRIVDWFGIRHVVCSKGTADVYNPKTVQASMGSLSRISVQYGDLAEFIRDTELPVFGAVLDGGSVYETVFPPEGIIVLGNEGNGIGREVLANIQHPVTIPRFGDAESLNVGVSAAIFCSEIARQKSQA